MPKNMKTSSGPFVVEVSFTEKVGWVRQRTVARACFFWFQSYKIEPLLVINTGFYSYLYIYIHNSTYPFVRPLIGVTTLFITIVGAHFAGVIIS